jgi:hypothetical protein
LGLAAWVSLLASGGLVLLGCVCIAVVCAHGWDGWGPEVILAGLALGSAACSTAAVGLGLSVWAMAGRDLGRMHRGLMDPGGREVVERARDRGQMTFGLGSGLTIFWAWMLFQVVATAG